MDDGARDRHRRATMSGNDSSATATLTPTSVAVVSAVISATEEEEEDPAALTLDCVEPTADMDLVNGPNPWLPAYGFQLQHHSQFQPTHLEDLRANGSYINVPTLFPFFFYILFIINILTFIILTRTIRHLCIRFGIYEWISIVNFICIN